MKLSIDRSKLNKKIARNSPKWRNDNKSIKIFIFKYNKPWKREKWSQQLREVLFWDDN